MSSRSVLGPGADQASSDSGRLISCRTAPASGVPRGSGSLYSTRAALGSTRIRSMNLLKTAPASGSARSHSGSTAFLRSSSSSGGSWPASARTPPTSALKPGNVLSVMIAAHDLAEQVPVKVLGAESRCLAGLRLVRTAGAGVDRVGSILQAHGDAALAALQKVIQGKALCGVDDHSGFLLCRRFPRRSWFNFTSHVSRGLCPWRHSALAAGAGQGLDKIAEGHLVSCPLTGRFGGWLGPVL